MVKVAGTEKEKEGRREEEEGGVEKSAETMKRWAGEEEEGGSLIRMREDWPEEQDADRS